MQSVKLDRFEGPLDSLLDLIEKEKLDISDVSLAKITEQYISYFQSIPDIVPETIANFLVIAAQLMLIKSRILIPQFEISEEEQKDIIELKIRLTQLQLLRNASKDLGKLYKENNCMYPRNPHLNPVTTFFMPPTVTPQLLSGVLITLISLFVKPEQLKKETMRVIISLEDRINELKKRFTDALKHSFSKLVDKKKSKLDIVVTFLALLELTKQKFIKLHQPQHFDDIYIEKI